MSRWVRRLVGSTLAVFAIAGAMSPAPAAASNSLQADRVCFDATRSASQTTSGRTTWYNRQASVQNVCGGFGGQVQFDLGAGVACTIIADAIGAKFHQAGEFTSGLCDGAELAGDDPSSTKACGVLSDLLGPVPIPIVKAFAIGAGVGCSLAGPFGGWIESYSERIAAQAVMQQGKCLRFEVHYFPIPDKWDAVPCAAGDTGLSTPSGEGTGGIVHGGERGHGSGPVGIVHGGGPGDSSVRGSVTAANSNGQMAVRLNNFPQGTTYFFCHAGGGYPTGGAVTNHGQFNVKSPNQSFSSGLCAGSGNAWIGLQATDGHDYYSNQVTLGSPPPTGAVSASNNNGQMAVQVTNFPTGLTYFFCHAGDPTQYPTGGTITFHGSVNVTSPNQSWSSGLCSGGHSTNMWIGFQGTDGHDYYSNQVVIDVAATPGASASVFSSNGQMSLQLTNFPTGTNYYFCHQGDPSQYPTGGTIIGHGQLSVTSPNGTYGPLCSGSGNAWIGVQGADGHDYYSNEITL